MPVEIYDEHAWEKAMDALTAVLMFYRVGHWTAADRELWKQITGKDEATTKVLASHVRGTLAYLECQFAGRFDAEAD